MPRVQIPIRHMFYVIEVKELIFMKKKYHLPFIYLPFLFFYSLDEAPPEGNDQAAEPSKPSPPQPSPPSMPNNEGGDSEEESGEEESENDGENDDEHGANAGMPLETFRAGLSHTKSVRSKTRSNPMCGVCRGCRTAYRCTDCNLAICAWATGRDC
jgi:hypothetical protein